MKFTNKQQKSNKRLVKRKSNTKKKSKKLIKLNKQRKNMRNNDNSQRKRKREPNEQKKCGYGLINSAINKLPFEMHLPGYRYCGPGTKLEKRLKRGDIGINPLDEACKNHDIAYSSKDKNVRRLADKELRAKAWQRVNANDSSFGEKTAAVTVAGLMKAKSGVEKIGGAHNYEEVLGNAIQEASTTLKKSSHNSEKEAARIAVRAAKAVVESKKGAKKNYGKCCKYRVISIPKTGGALPFLIPLFAGLSAIGSLAGGTAAVVNAVNATKNARLRLKESERHNEMMEAIALNKKGSGLHLKPYRKGLGLYLNPQIKSKNY